MIVWNHDTFFFLSNEFIGKMMKNINSEQKNWNFVHVLLCVEQELDNWLRKKCLENLAKSISTLQSLTALLEGISNIVIQEDIGQQVYFSNLV